MFTITNERSDGSMKDESRTINGICSQVGVNPTEFNEVLRRIERVVLEENAQVISKVIGTFYRRDSRPTTKTLNGVVYQVPARSCVQLRPTKFVPQEQVCQEPPLDNVSGTLQGNSVESFEGSLPSFAIGTTFNVLMEITDTGEESRSADRPGVRSRSSVMFGSNSGASTISTSVGGVFDLLNGGFQFGYVDHPGSVVSLGDKFGLAIEVLGNVSSGLVECRVDRVLNGVTSISSIESYRPCDLEVTFSFSESELSLLDDLQGFTNPFPKAMNYEIIV